jgi:hypothetical protein
MRNPIQLIISALFLEALETASKRAGEQNPMLFNPLPGDDDDDDVIPLPEKAGDIEAEKKYYTQIMEGYVKQEKYEEAARVKQIIESIK